MMSDSTDGKKIVPMTGHPSIPEIMRVRSRMKRAFAAGADRVDYFPLYLWLEPTNRCNLRCPMCPQSAGLKRPMGRMDPALLEKIIEQAKGKSHLISMHFAGEPLLHGDIAVMVSIAAGSGLPVVMHSNGTLMNEDVARGLIKAGLAQIVFSFDAVPMNEYSRKRPPADFDDTLSRIRKFLEVKKQMKSRWPLVTIKSIMFYEKGKDLAAPGELRALFEGLPVDNFAVEWAHSFSGAFGQEASSGNRYSVQERGAVHTCVLPWFGYSIAWDGTAYACCNDLNGECRLGDVKESSLEDVWNGEPMRALRSALAAKDPSRLPLCVSCDSLYREFRPEKIYEEGLRYAMKHIARPLVYPYSGGKLL